MPRRRDTPCAGGCGSLLWPSRTGHPPPTCRACRAVDRATWRTERVCARPECSARYTPTYQGQQCCSRGCAQAVRSARARLTCQAPGCTQQYRPSYTGQATCGRTCGVALARHRGTQLPARAQRATRVQYKGCPICGALWVWAACTGRPKRAECPTHPDAEVQAHRRARANAAARAQRATQRLEYKIECGFCGGEFTGVSTRRYCSARCSKRYELTQRECRRGRFRPTPAQRKRIHIRDGMRCHLCNTHVRTDVPHEHTLSATLDHVIPQSIHTDHSDDNLKTAHRWCNTIRGNAPLPLPPFTPPPTEWCATQYASAQHAMRIATLAS